MQKKTQRKRIFACDGILRTEVILICLVLEWIGFSTLVPAQEINRTRVKSQQDTFSVSISDLEIAELPLRISKSTSESYLNPKYERRIRNTAFNVGEYLVFDIVYGIVKAGTASMSIPDTQRIDNRPCYHIVTTAESSPFFSAFFRVDDRLESFVDMEGIFPWKFEKHLREGKYHADRYVIYDQNNLRAVMNKDTLLTPPFVQGVLSAFYYARTLPLEIGKTVSIDTYSDGKLYPLKVLIHKREEVSVPAGRFKCILVEPMLEGEGIFSQKGGITIWLTDDERRMPVLVKSKVLIGSISIRLTAIQSQTETIQ
jgi:hypothetical protein